MNDSAYTLHVDIERRNKGRFMKGCTPWNKGVSWKQQGYTEERRNKVVEILRKNKSKNTYKNTGDNLKHPVIQMDEYGNRLHWYQSSAHAGRKLGITARNIRSVCYGKKRYCGGFRWKFDERFL